jgi:hypothetical protein
MKAEVRSPLLFPVTEPPREWGNDTTAGNLNVSAAYSLFCKDQRYDRFRPFFPSAAIPPLLRIGLSLTGFGYFGFRGTYHLEEMRNDQLAAGSNRTNLPSRFTDLNYKFTYGTYIFYLSPVFCGAFGRKEPARYGYDMILSRNIAFLDMIEGSVDVGPIRLFSLFSSIPPPHDQGEWDYGSQRYFLWHGITLRLPFHLEIGACEALIISGRRPDLADLNPLILWHNLVRKGNNVITGVRLQWTPHPTFDLRFESALDDIRWTDVEPGSVRPTATGFAATAIWMPVVGQGRLKCAIECIQTDRWLYNREEEDMKYLINDEYMGYWLGPGRRDVFFLLGYHHREIRGIDLFAGFMQQGEVSIDTPYMDGGYPGWSPLCGTTEKSVIWGADILWRFNAYLSLWFRIHRMDIMDWRHERERDIRNHWEWFFRCTVSPRDVSIPFAFLEDLM